MRMRIQATRRSRFIGTLPDGLRRESASESEDPAHARVSEVDAVAVHHRAGARDHADIVLTAILDSPRRDTRSLTYGLVHPRQKNGASIVRFAEGRPRAPPPEF